MPFTAPGALQPPPPGALHPAGPRRPIYSLEGRASPRLYAAGWVLSLAGLALLAAGIAGSSGGLDRRAILALVEAAAAGLTAGLLSAAFAQGLQRRADGWQDYSGPSPLLATAAFLAYSTATSLALVFVLTVLGMRPADSFLTVLLLLVNLAGYVGLTHLLVIRPGVLTWRDVARPRRLAPDRNDLLAEYWAAFRPGRQADRLRVALGDVGAGFALALPAVIATGIFVIVLVFALGLQGVDTSEGGTSLATDWDILLTVLSLTVIAPIGEEIFFRGFATNAWARSLARNQALVRSAMLFASVHVINISLGSADPGLILRLALLAIGSRIPVGWLLCWIYTSRKSILASIALHATYNGSLVLLSLWALSHTP